MKALAAAYFLVAALAMPALLWAADDPPADPATATTPAPPPGDPAPAQTAPPPAPAPEPEPAAQPAPAQAAPAPATAQPATATEPGPAEEQTKPASAPRAAPKARAAGSQTVPIQGFAFKPATVTVNVGDTVTWTNQDTAPHKRPRPTELRHRGPEEGRQRVTRVLEGRLVRLHLHDPPQHEGHGRREGRRKRQRGRRELRLGRLRQFSGSSGSSDSSNLGSSSGSRLRGRAPRASRHRL